MKREADMNNPTQEPDRCIREPEEKHITGLSRTTRWRLERAGKYPKRIQISENAKARLLSQIVDWMAARVKAT